MHAVDRLFGWMGQRRLMFEGGWGDEKIIAELTGPEVVAERAAEIDLRWTRVAVRGGREVREGEFLSPVARLPWPVRRARVRVWRRLGARPRASCVVLAASREQTFTLREHAFGALVDEGIELVLLENAFYGRRRPRGQLGPALRFVSDQLLMSLATLEETRALVAALRDAGREQVGVAGYSMGGYMAGLAAAYIDGPMAIAALAAGVAPAPVFTDGMLSRSIDFVRLGGGDAAGARARLTELFDRAALDRHRVAPAGPRAVVVACEHDGYVPHSETLALARLWRGAELRWIDAGHMSAPFTAGAELRAAVRDAFARAA